MTLNARPRALTVVARLANAAAANPPPEEETAEINELAQAANFAVMATQVFNARVPRPATYIGSGMADKTRELAQACNAQRVIFACNLNITQTRNLEKQIGLPVMDRTALILTIFSLRATTHEGKLQAKLAQIKQQMGEISGLWTHLERQRGGIGVRGGPGEKQLEIDRRLLAQKARKLEKQISQAATRGNKARERRRKNGAPTAALVGYTNAGKSSLFNLLAGETRPANNRIFDTLDTTARRVRLPCGRRFILTDTVGFIRNLPHALLAGFRATLQDTADSDLLLIVADISCPNWQERLQLAEEQLDSIGATKRGRIVVFNKIDKAGARARVSDWGCGRIPAVYVSCHTQEGAPLLRRLIAERLQTGEPPCFGGQNQSHHAVF